MKNSARMVGARRIAGSWRASRAAWAACAALIAAAGLAVPILASITPEHRKEIAEIRTSLGKVAGLVTKKQYDEAARILDDAEARIKKVAQAAQVPETDRAFSALWTTINTNRTKIARLTSKANPAAGPSFLKTVAPLLTANCTRCHGSDRASGGLRLDTFAGLEAGGDSGPLLVVGNAAQSLLVQRLQAAGNMRMPRNADPLAAAEIKAISDWIARGAKFDGSDKQAAYSAQQSTGDEKVEIALATGDEKVSFTRDIAPFMVNLCGGCHSAQQRRGGLCLETFEDLMKGGASGRVILPGNLEGSRLWRLVGGLEAPRMPQGQARITRKNYEDLKTWLEEGAKFDGKDPKAALRSLVPTEEEKQAAELAKLTPEEFAQFRQSRTEQQWKRAHPREEPQFIESENFLIYGNVGAERLKEVDAWADEHLELLRKTFGMKTGEVWRGKLAVFVFRDRFSYEEFPRTIERREVPPELHGHVRITANSEDAYICVQDAGDEPSASIPDLKLNLLDQMTGAFLLRRGRAMPDWLVRGTGLALGARGDRKNAYVVGLWGRAKAALAAVNSPADVFAAGTFSSGDVGPVGFTIVEYMLSAGGAPRFAQFVDRLQQGTDFPAALRAVYQTDTNGLAAAYAAWVSKDRPGGPAKKSSY